MRLKRPHIPMAIRLEVALQQLASLFKCSRDQLQLDHNPALANRPFDEETGLYTPDANDPDYLVWRVNRDHDIKTRVRGEHGQYSDLALIRREKRRRKALAGKPKAKIAQRKNPWPPKGSRKLGGGPTRRK